MLDMGWFSWFSGLFGKRTFDKPPAFVPVKNHVRASSFADPADIRRFERCKDSGLSDQECFRIGDNGVGCYGDDCSAGSGPSCALPPEVMEQNWGGTLAAKHQPVRVARDNKEVTCLIKDRMPHLANIHNGARIDLNPDAGRALGLEPPFMVDVIWWKP